MDTNYLIMQGVLIVLGAVVGGLSALAKGYYDKLAKHNRHEQDIQAALISGVRAELKLSLLKSYAYYKKLGYCPIEEIDSMKEIYESYHTLGGNGTGTSIYESILAMGHNAPSADRSF